MKTRFILYFLMLFRSFALLAENYPYRSDVLWMTEPDHPDWIYHTGEQAEIEVRLYLYGMPQDGVKVDYELADDLMPADSHGSVTLRNRRGIIKAGTMKKPGFRDCRLTAHLQGKTYRHHIKVGFSPEQIRPYTHLSEPVPGPCPRLCDDHHGQRTDPSGRPTGAGQDHLHSQRFPPGKVPGGGRGGN